MLSIRVFMTGLLMFGCGGISLAQDGSKAAAGNPIDGTTKGVDPIESSPAEKKEIKIGLDAEVGVHTIYCFRGLNVFQHGGQMDQNSLLSLDLSWSIAETGLWVEYWSGWQISGPNISELIDQSIGAEQDILAGYDLKIQEQIELGAFAVIYFYPYSKSIPKTYLEAGAEITWSSFIEAGFTAAYFQPWPDDAENDLYVYLNLHAGKEVEVHQGFTLNGEVSFGWKILTVMKDNILDLQASVSGEIFLVKDLCMVIGANIGWTDLDGVDAIDEIMIWASVSFQASL